MRCLGEYAKRKATHGQSDRDRACRRALDLGGRTVQDVSEEEDALSSRELVLKLGGRSLEEPLVLKLDLRDGQLESDVNLLASRLVILDEGTGIEALEV